MSLVNLPSAALLVYADTLIAINCLLQVRWYSQQLLWS